MCFRQLSDKNSARDKKLKKILKVLIMIAILLNVLLCIYLYFHVKVLQEQKDIVYDNNASKRNTEVHNLETEVWAEQRKFMSSELEKAKEDKYRKKAEQKKVYLTFDDGPSANTGQILDILKMYNVKATFFVVGKRDDNSIAMYKRIVEEGHTLGMHSYSHEYEKVYSSIKEFTNDFKKLQDHLYKITGIKSKIYRFPGGSSNSVSKIDMKEFIKYLDAKDVIYFDWNLSNGDANSKIPPLTETLVENVMQGIEKYQDSVVLMHDLKDKVNTIDSLPILIEEMQKLGFQIKAIDHNTKPIQHIKVEDAWKNESVEIEEVDGLE